MTATLARPTSTAPATFTEARTGFLDLAHERVVLYDGSMGATVLNMQLTAEDYGGLEGCNENLVFVKPDLIAGLHAGYFEIGCDIVETDTFAGSIGPTGLLPASEDPMLGQHRFHEVVELFLDQIRGLVDGGSDVLIIETVQDIL